MTPINRFVACLTPKYQYAINHYFLFTLIYLVADFTELRVFTVLICRIIICSHSLCIVDAPKVILGQFNPSFGV